MENILHGEEARDKLLLGVNKVANAIKGTLGANAGTVIIQNPAGLPLILNDGVSITKSITDPDPYIQMGINLMQEVAHEAQSKSGDGTTTATILAQALCNTMADDDTDNIKIKETLTTMCKYIVDELKEMATDVNTDDLLDVCIVASNNDVELGRLIHQALLAVGEEGNVIIESNSDSTTTWSLTEGLVMDSGYVNKLMANADREKCIYDNASILLTQEKIETFNHIVPALELSMKAGKPLVIVCHDYNPSILPNLLVNIMQGKLNVCIVKTAGFGDTQDHWLQDIEAKCGGKVFNSFDSIIKVKENELGICDKVEITSTTSTFIKDGVDEDYIGNLTSILTQVETDFEREIVENRIARLTSGIASIKVGGITDIEQRERRERVDDAVNAATLARKQGVVCGGGVALKDIWWKTLPLHDKMDGKIYFDAILAPIKQILSNSGEPMKNLAYVKSKGEGYNAVSRKYQNLRFHGIIDPVGVSINAVESAFSIAILLLTTDCAIIAPQE
jgi:chaperonin GroEL|tara:strand:- start:2380 stop:3897 length:1518 start_codon:yes stop_codon:yes gene_type:complete